MRLAANEYRILVLSRIAGQMTDKEQDRR